MASIEFSMKTVSERRKRVKTMVKSRYDPIIDQFLEGDHKLVEINGPGKNGSYIKTQLSNRIKRRELDLQVSSVGEYVYLEKGKKPPEEEKSESEKGKKSQLKKD